MYDYGNLLTVEDGEGNTITKNSYDDRGRLTLSVDGEGGETRYRYNEYNEVIETVNALNQSTKYSYDTSGRLVSTTDNAGSVSENSYDQKGNLESIKGPDSETYQLNYTYDSMGRIDSECDSLNHVKFYSYNAAGLLKEQRNARDQKTTYTYDGAGRITSKTDELGTVYYTYDKNGNVETVKDKVGTIRRTYDALNRVKTYTDVNGKTIEYSYNEFGDLEKLTYPGGKIVSYTYLENGKIESVTDWEGRKTTYQYDGNNRLIEAHRPDGSVEHYEYDACGRLTHQIDVKGEKEIQSYEYTYDKGGRLKEITANETESLQEDTTIVADTVDESSETQMTYDSDNRLATYNGEPVQYDADGNMTYGPLNGKMTTFEYDCRNRLIKAGDTTYTYDAEDTRIAMQTPTTKTQYVVDGVAEYSQVLQETKTDLATKKQSVTTYAYGNGLLGSEEDSGTNTGAEGTDKDTIVDTYQVYHFNQLGSTTVITNMKGEVEKRFTYDTYGKVTSGDTTGITFLYNGMYGVQTDGNGLYYMRARYYNVDIKRFINKDIITGDITNSQSLNRYCYVQGNPVTLTDPFGLCPQDDVGFWSKNGHSILNLIGIIPGIGDLADVVNCAWYLAEKDYANALSSAISVLPAAGSLVGNTIRLGAKCNVKAVKLAEGIESVSSLVSNTATMTRAAASGTTRAIDMVQKYAIDGEKVSGETAEEALGLGMDILTTLLTGKGMKKNVGELTSIKGKVVKSANVEEVRKTDFYVTPSGEAVPATGYRYTARSVEVVQNARNGRIVSRSDGTYFSFDKMEDAIVAQGKLQIPYRPEYRIEFDTLDIIDDINIPKGNWGRADYDEPVTKDFRKYGPGKATQAITYSQINSVNKIYKMR